MEGGRAGLQIRSLFVFCRGRSVGKPPCCVFKKKLESILEDSGKQLVVEAERDGDRRSARSKQGERWTRGDP